MEDQKMTEDQTVLMQVYAQTCALRSELAEFKRETLRRLETLESEKKGAAVRFTTVAAAAASIAGSVVSCFSRFLPARR